MRKKSVWLTWIYLTAKRYCVRAAFLLALLLLPMLCFLLRIAYEEDSETGEINIAVYLDCPADADQTMERELLRILSEEITDFTFYECDSADEAASDVASLKAAGGVIIHGSLREKVASGETDGMFALISSTQDVTMRVCREYIYAAYAKLVGSDVVVNVLAQALGVTGEDYDTMKEQVEEIYARRLSTSEYNMFEYVETSGTTDPESESAGETDPESESAGETDPENESADASDGETAVNQSQMVRGFAAVWLFAAGLFLAAELRRKQKQGHYLRFDAHGVWLAKAIDLLIPLLLLGGSALAGIAISGNFTQVLREAGCLLCYIAEVTLVCLALAALIRSEQILTGMIPVLILASLVLCPVFLDFSGLLPILKTVRMVLPPSWYLAWF